jgi:peroxiredoxin
MPGDALAAAVGQPAPHFTLPSVQGPTIDLKSYHGRRNVIVWFSRGFTCPFCRGYMQGVIEGYQNLLAQATEVVQVTPNLLESARRFFRPDPVPYRWCAIPTSGSTRCTGWATGACSPPRARAW